MRARLRDLSGRAFDEEAGRARMSVAVFFPVYAEARLPTSSRLLERVQNDFRQRREGRRARVAHWC